MDVMLHIKLCIAERWMFRRSFVCSFQFIHFDTFLSLFLHLLVSLSLSRTHTIKIAEIVQKSRNGVQSFEYVILFSYYVEWKFNRLYKSRIVHLYCYYYYFFPQHFLPLLFWIENLFILRFYDEERERENERFK